MGSYIVQGAKLSCSMGDKDSTLKYLWITRYI